MEDRRGREKDRKAEEGREKQIETEASSQANTTEDNKYMETDT